MDAHSRAVGGGACSPPYSKLYIYHTKHSFLVVGHRERSRYALLRITRQDSDNLQATEDPVTYNLQELNQLLRSTHASCAQQGGLQFVTKAYGVVGCIRFTAAFYLLIITRRSYVGSICGHKVYSVRGVSLLPLGAAMGVSQQKDSPTERRYRKLLMGLDLSKDFYFSVTYNLAATLQRNYQDGLRYKHSSVPGRAQHDQNTPPHQPVFAASVYSEPDFESSPFIWNSYLTRSLRAVLRNQLWVVALIHGAWDQRRLSVLGQPMTLTLVGRRSRYFAGTRFKKRGLSDQGKVRLIREHPPINGIEVANEVEVEQILDVGYDYGSGLPIISSIVQVRGSVPLYWSQQPTPLSPKPDILLQNFDPLYQATELHFADLRARYGAPTVCLNLLKSRERRARETLLRRELAVAINMLNARAKPDDLLVHIPWDFQKHARLAGPGLLSEMSHITHLSLEATGLFVHNPSICFMSQLLAQQGTPLIPSSHPSTDAAMHLGEMPSTVQRTESVSISTAADLHSQEQARLEHRRAYKRWFYTLEQADQPPLQSSQGNSADVTPFGSGLLCSPFAVPSTATAIVGSDTAPPWHCLYQHGVLRTNCIDCLDRTNVAQFAYGLVAFGLQLYLLGIAESPEIDSDSSMALVLMEQYEILGNTLAMQYGGSDAHNSFFQRKKGQSEASSRSKDLMTSIQRFYSNTYTDAEKQDAINLVLGSYIPGQPGQPELWELEHDAYLHNTPDVRLFPTASSLMSTRAPAPLRPLPAAPLAITVPHRPHSRSYSRSSINAQRLGTLDTTAVSSPSFAMNTPSLMSRAQSVTGTPKGQDSQARVTQGGLQEPDSPVGLYTSASQGYPEQPPSFGMAIDRDASMHSTYSGESLMQAATRTSTIGAASMGGGDTLSTSLSARLRVGEGRGEVRGGGGGGAGAGQGLSRPSRWAVTSSVSLVSLSSDDEAGPASTPRERGTTSSTTHGFVLGDSISDTDYAASTAMQSHRTTASGSGLGSGTLSLGFGQSGFQTQTVPDAAWSFGSLWSSLFGLTPRAPPAVPLPSDERPFLQCFDVVLSQPCSKGLPVRLYALNRRGYDTPIMWQSVQQAFSFFWTPQDAEDAGLGPDDLPGSQLIPAGIKDHASPSAIMSSTTTTAAIAMQGNGTKSGRHSVGSGPGAEGSGSASSRVLRGFNSHMFHPLPPNLCVALLNVGDGSAPISLRLDHSVVPDAQHAQHAPASCPDNGSLYAAALLDADATPSRPSNLQAYQAVAVRDATASMSRGASRGTGWTASRSRRKAVQMLLFLGRKHGHPLRHQQLLTPQPSMDLSSAYGMLLKRIPSLSSIMLTPQPSTTPSMFGSSTPTKATAPHKPLDALAVGGGMKSKTPSVTSMASWGAMLVSPAVGSPVHAGNGHAQTGGGTLSTFPHAGCLPSFWAPDSDILPHFNHLLLAVQSKDGLGPDMGVVVGVTCWVWSLQSAWPAIQVTSHLPGVPSHSHHTVRHHPHHHHSHSFAFAAQTRTASGRQSAAGARLSLSGNIGSHTTNNNAQNAALCIPASMAALGRVPVGIGPHSAGYTRTSGSGAAPSRQLSGPFNQLPQAPPTPGPSSSAAWDLTQYVSPTNLLTAIAQIGSQPKEAHKPPIPELNDFIEIGPQARATLAARTQAALAALKPGATTATATTMTTLGPRSGGNTTTTTTHTAQRSLASNSTPINAGASPAKGVQSPSPPSRPLSRTSSMTGFLTRRSSSPSPQAVAGGETTGGSRSWLFGKRSGGTSTPVRRSDVQPGEPLDDWEVIGNPDLCKDGPRNLQKDAYDGTGLTWGRDVNGYLPGQVESVVDLMAVPGRHQQLQACGVSNPWAVNHPNQVDIVHFNTPAAPAPMSAPWQPTTTQMPVGLAGPSCHSCLPAWSAWATQPIPLCSATT